MRNAKWCYACLIVLIGLGCGPTPAQEQAEGPSQPAPSEMSVVATPNEEPETRPQPEAEVVAAAIAVDQQPAPEEPAPKPPEKKQPEPKKPALEAVVETPLENVQSNRLEPGVLSFEHLQAEIAANFISVESAKDGKAFHDTTPGGVLVGFDVSTVIYNGRFKVVASLRPVYQQGEELILGKTYGKEEPNVQRLQAKAGYAVGGIQGTKGARIDGLCLVYMRRNGDRLEPGDQYYSRWIGSELDHKIILLGGDGRPVLGIQGTTGNEILRLGLIQ